MWFFMSLTCVRATAITIMRSIVIRVKVVNNMGLTWVLILIKVVCSMNAGRVLRCRIILLRRIITLCCVTVLCPVVLLSRVATVSLCRVTTLFGIATAVNTCEYIREM